MIALILNSRLLKRTAHTLMDYFRSSQRLRPIERGMWICKLFKYRSMASRRVNKFVFYIIALEVHLCTFPTIAPQQGYLSTPP